MRIGLRSLLFGVHHWALHPLFVAAAWVRLYGWPWDPRLWLAFVVHDWGYAACRSMDGADGEQHPWLGARLCSIFGPGWRLLLACHSRFLADECGMHISRLCVADKLAGALYPVWLYTVLARLSGELREYQALSGSRYAAHPTETDAVWVRSYQQWCRKYATQNREQAWTVEDYNAYIAR